MGHGTSTARIPAAVVVEVLLTDNQRIPSDHILAIHDAELLKICSNCDVTLSVWSAASRFPLFCVWLGID